MPRLILKCPYLKGGGGKVSTHLGNLVNYIATRDGVAKIDNKTKNLLVTEKQQKLIVQILKEFPECKNIFEYEDFIQNSTRENATEFITTALEQNFDRLGNRRNYVDYIANRPRVQKLGSHGLFTGNDDSLVLSKIADEVSNHTGNVWTPIISLRREDAVRLGYDCAEHWQALLSSNTIEMADSLKIHPDHLKWYAAFHNESHHPHIHMICYSTDPKEGYLTKSGIEKMKSGLVQKIFGDELKGIYIEQTKRRNFLNQQSRELMGQLISEMQNSTLQNSKIEELFSIFAERLKFASGKKQYGYLRPPLKAMVDEIVDELAKDESIDKAYKLWYEMRNEVLHSYMEELPEPVLLSQQKEFKSIKNMIIKEADTLSKNEISFEEVPTTNDTLEETDNADDFVSDDVVVDNVETNATDFIEDKSITGTFIVDDTNQEVYVKWSEEYKKAREFLFGTDDILQDFEQAFALFESESEKGNALAIFDMGRMFADGLGMNIDTQKAHVYYAKALSAFQIVESKKAWEYTEYRIGKMFAQGLGTQQDYEKAGKWFTMSAKEKYKYAEYSLGGLYYRGQGIEQSYEIAFELYLKSAKQGFPYADFEVAKMYRDGIGTAKNDKESNKHFHSAFIGFESLEKQSHDDKIQYRLGWMLQTGIGTEKDIKQAKEYFEKSASVGNTFACYSLAKLILAEENPSEEEVQKAIQYLQNASDNGNQFAQYALAKFYLNAKYLEKDIEKAVKLFTLSAEQENEYAAYQLGKLYLKGEDISKDIPTAIKWLSLSAEKGNQFAEYSLGMLYLKGEELPRDIEKSTLFLKRSAEQKNQFAQYQLGRLYLKGEDVSKDMESAISYLTSSAEQGNQFAQYILGKLYLMGKDVPKNKEIAIKWLTLSAEQGNEYAQFFLDIMDKFQNPSFYIVASRMLHHMSQIFENNIPLKSSGTGLKIDSKLMRKLKEKKMAQGHKRDDNEQNMTL